MFGHQINGQDNGSGDGVQPPTAAALPASPQSQPFNPALPPTGMPFGAPPNSQAAPPADPAPSEPSYGNKLVLTPPAASEEQTDYNTDDLIAIKQQALNQLSPLVDHLDQTPEEKFRTTMMMIQATDNQALVKDAYAAAQSITDEKAKAQALLDIVNEINYFTQHHEA